ncbi:glycosyltransferase [Saccharothrix longispora]|uniref:glycosyltransferase n=1 Tax=Saccharothrix longispora TaxID=33920 RepID=UPI0028FDB1B8|nr:glycosyltransferase [Saccharothrix longispora]MBY8851027.1 glycosyltransferase [Saccharothrix sp. MB29]MDU0293338.1 glycosyltransferase [Saccharothrix longispora]
MGKWGVLGAAVAVARAAVTMAVWRQVRRLPERGVRDGSVTVVVPARDEERSIDRCLTALRAQDYADLRIVVVDDASADRTAGIVRRHAEQDPRVTLISSSGPPPGWAGKVHALHVGTAGLDTDWLLCFDADTEAAPDLVGRLVAAARRDRVDLVSTSGRAARPNPGWWLLLPPTNQLLFESTTVDGRRGKALAVGHCILVSREAYERSGGWAAIAASRADDVDFATLVRDTGGRTRYSDGADSLATSGMDTFGDTWASMRKSMVAGTATFAKGPRTAFLMLVGTGTAHVLFGAVPLVAALRGSRPGLVAWLAQSAALHAFLRRAHQPRAAALLGPLAPLVFGVLALEAAWHALRGTTRWKGRDVRG